MITVSASTDLRELPLTLYDLHRSLEPGQTAAMELAPNRGQDHDDVLPFLIEGAGFDLRESLPRQATPGQPSQHVLRRLRTLSDCVDASMATLIVGLNPSLHAADAGYGFSGPSNRFWKAAIEADLTDRRGEPRLTLTEHRVGFTDLVKRATARASELSRSEFADGIPRLEALTELLQPGVVVVAGVTGWRAATGEPGKVGLQERRLGGRPVWLMPNPSGLNAHTNHADLVEHLTSAHALGLRGQE